MSRSSTATLPRGMASNASRDRPWKAAGAAAFPPDSRDLPAEPSRRLRTPCRGRGAKRHLVRHRSFPRWGPPTGSMGTNWTGRRPVRAPADFACAYRRILQVRRRTASQSTRCFVSALTTINGKAPDAFLFGSQALGCDMQRRDPRKSWRIGGFLRGIPARSTRCGEHDHPVPRVGRTRNFDPCNKYVQSLTPLRRPAWQSVKKVLTSRLPSFSGRRAKVRIFGGI